jgi:hypothetical protein
MSTTGVLASPASKITKNSGIVVPTVGRFVTRKS